MTNTSEQPVASGSRPTTSREERLQTFTKLMLGHLIEYERGRSEVIVTFRGTFASIIYKDPFDVFPSEELMAHLALALDRKAWDSCKMSDLDDETIRRMTR